MRCIQCGQENPEDAEYCSSCGNFMQQSTQSEQAQEEQEDPAKYQGNSDYALPVLGWLSNILIIVFLPILNISNLTFNISTIVLGVIGVIFGAMHLRYKKIHGIIIIIVSIAVAASVALSSFGETDSENTNSGQPEEKKGPHPDQSENQPITQKNKSDEKDKVYAAGDTATIGNFMGESIDVTIQDASLSKPETDSALENDMVLTVEIAAENTGDGSITVNEDNFSVYDSNDAEAKSYHDDQDKLLQEDLDPGSQLEGEIHFDVNESDSYEVVYQPFASIDDKKVTFQVNID